jgi:hypothetical protein
MVGMGVAAAFRNNLLMKSGARVRLGKDGRVASVLFDIRARALVA